MSEEALNGWSRLRHGGLLLDAPRQARVAESVPPALSAWAERELRRRLSLAQASAREADAGFVRFVLEEVCGFKPSTGTWAHGSSVGTEHTRRAVTGEAVRPRSLWRGANGAVLPVFFDAETRIGVGRGRKSASSTLQWMRGGSERLALLTNGRQWRLLFAGLDFDAWCEWDVDLWLEEGALSPQVDALRALLQPALWTPPSDDASSPLLQAILDSRKGQAELSASLGERVREAVEMLVRGHGEALKARCADVAPADIYRAAVRVVMRMVVVMFAESRDLLPRDNALYHGAYGLNGLLESLQKIDLRGGRRLARSWTAWPRVLSLFRLVYHGSGHERLPVPAYGGDLFTPGTATHEQGIAQALAVFESACFDSEALPDSDVLQILERLTRTRVTVRQGRSTRKVTVPIDFADLSSEYIGLLYEGLLDFELKTAPEGDPIVFLNLGQEPALPLSRLEAMDDGAIKNLVEKMKKSNQASDDDEQEDDEAEEEGDEPAGADESDEGEADADEGEAAGADDDGDARHQTRSRAEQWARRAVLAGKMVSAPRGKLTPEKQLAHDKSVGDVARSLVRKVVLPGEWFVVRWGGTRKGAGTFYTRPGLAVPTVQRTLRPLAFDAPLGADGKPDLFAPASGWTPKPPEAILALQVCDPACGSGTFPVTALRFLTDALFASLHHHGRIRDDGEKSIIRLLQGGETEGAESSSEELIPCRQSDESFEGRLKAVLRRHVVERCIYGVDLDPLAVELCRLSLWIETMDRRLPFSFIDHKIKCGNSLVGAWLDTFRHYPVMAWKNREGGDKNHTNGVHFEKEARTKAIKAFVKDTLTPDLHRYLTRPQLWKEKGDDGAALQVHDKALQALRELHDLPVHLAAEHARVYREKVLSPEWRALKEAMDLWCACWFWPADEIAVAPLPSTFAASPEETAAVARHMAATQRFFHWEIEFPDVFRAGRSGFDAVLGNPPWNIAKPVSKEFFSDIDPLYRSYGKQEAQGHQEDYFASRNIEHAWLDYNAQFKAQSNFLGYVASPFGDPVSEKDNSPRFTIARGSANEDLHADWRRMRSGTRGFADKAHPFRHQGSADLNLYKLFIELAHSLLRHNGRLGFIIPSGLYSDHGTADLRRLLFDNCRWEWLFGFENRNKLFDIDGRFKFNLVVVCKGGKTEAVRTAFMRRRLEDWEHAERYAIPYTRAQVEKFSPYSRSILEIQSARDLNVLEKIYANSVLLGDDGPDGWGVKYATEFHMTNDSKLFPPRPKWEAQGYRPDEYNRWLQGPWKPIESLWRELGIDPARVVPIDAACVKDIAARGADVQKTNGHVRCAQPPYDSLPIPRADIPTGIVLSREADAWIREEEITGTSLPLYEGRMIGQFDFSQKGWLSGKGRAAMWRDIGYEGKSIEPQYLMNWSDCEEREVLIPKLPLMNISSATNSRTLVSTFLQDFPCNHSLNPLRASNQDVLLALALVLNSYSIDYTARARQSGLNVSFFMLDELAVPHPDSEFLSAVGRLSYRLSLASPLFARNALSLSDSVFRSRAWRRPWAVTKSERVRLRAMADAVTAGALGLNCEDYMWLLQDCDAPLHGAISLEARNAKGFWRIDLQEVPELRHTVLSVVALHDLEAKIADCGGDRDKGIETFLAQNNGEGWMLPETLRLADYGLGHDERAQHLQPVASRLGPRLYDWQLAQTAEESWRECSTHGANLTYNPGPFVSNLRGVRGSIAKGRNLLGLDQNAEREPHRHAQGMLFD